MSTSSLTSNLASPSVPQETDDCVVPSSSGISGDARALKVASYVVNDDIRRGAVAVQSEAVAVGGAGANRQQVVVARDVAVPGQVVWVLRVSAVVVVVVVMMAAEQQCAMCS
ncbi:hypothetical protein INR49_020140 [Caranx melampygus]|nr:hypothetical protein INR49_020140 [Caranx melampygus]